jgi:hypothetical protein
MVCLIRIDPEHQETAGQARRDVPEQPASDDAPERIELVDALPISVVARALERAWWDPP